MSYQAVHIEGQPLRMQLKTIIRHAAATRKVGEGVWVKAERSSAIGFGEGCPRAYAAGDDLEQSVL